MHLSISFWNQALSQRECFQPASPLAPAAIFVQIKQRVIEWQQPQAVLTFVASFGRWGLRRMQCTYGIHQIKVDLRFDGEFKKNLHLFLVLQHLVGFLLLLWWHNVILIKRLCVAHFRQLFQANITAAGFCAKLKQCHWLFAQTFFLNPNPCQKKTWFTPEIMGSINRQPSQGIQCWLLWLCSKGVALWGEC